MKSTNTLIPEPKKTYPYLGISTVSDGLVVLFFGPDEGTVVSEASENKIGEYKYKLGQYRNDWWEKAFDLYTGEILLSN